MKAALRRRLEMAMRVREFLRAHPTEGPEAAALAHLEELLQRAEALAAQQRSGVVSSRSSAMQRGELRHALETKLLKYLAAVGAVAARDNTELAAPFRLPRGGSNQAFLTAARGVLEEATAQKELLVGRGMSDTLLDDLTAALTEFEHTLEASRTGRREHVGATADLWAVAAQITAQVRLLDGRVRYRFGDSAGLRGAWASAHNGVGRRRSDGASGPDAGAVPPGAGDAPAAGPGPDAVQPAA